MRTAAAAVVAAAALACVGAVESAFTRTVRAPSKFAAAPVFAPRLVAPPRIEGEPTDGETLTATAGTWARRPRTFLVEWLRCAAECVRVSEGATRELTADEVGTRMRVRVTATNDGGDTAATSEPTATVAPLAPPHDTSSPTIDGAPTVGQTLTADDGSWSGRRVRITRRWLRCETTCTSIPGETDPTYLVTGDDAGAAIKVEATATNTGGAATATSHPTATVTRATYTQFLCANPATGLGLAGDMALPDGFRFGGSLVYRSDPRAVRCGEGTPGTGIPVTTSVPFSTWTPDDRVVLEYRMQEATDFLGATIYRYGRMGGAFSWAIQTSTATGLFAGPRAELCSWGHGCHTRGSETDPFAAQNRVVVAPGSVDGFNVTLACDIGWGGRCDSDGSQIVRLFGGVATLRDTATPQLTRAPTGSLLDGPLEEVEDLELAATDAGSGVYRLRIRIDDREVASRVLHDEGGRCADRAPGDDDPYEFAHRRACPASIATSLSFDTSAWPKTGRLRVYLEDAGRNTTVVLNRAL